MSLTSLTVLAVCTETLITAINDAVKGGIKWQMIVSWVVGCTIAIAYNADILAAEGLVSGVPYIGNIITGLSIGRGSNFFFDMIKAMKTGSDSVA